MSTNGASAEPLLELRGISKSFGAVQALTKVDFRAIPGEVMALVGDNGAGKSTLIKGVAGIYPLDEGEIFFEGQQVKITAPRDAAALGIEVVYQDLALADNLDVVGNMFLGRERVKTVDIPVPTNIRNSFKSPLMRRIGTRLKFLSRFGARLDEATMEQQCIDTLSSLSVRTLRSVRVPISALSGGQRQSVAIAKAVMWNSKLVILDEPTAALGVAQTKNVLELVRTLADRGLAVVLISHNLHDILEVADRITVLRLGYRVSELSVKDLMAQMNNKRDKVYEYVVREMTAGELSRVPGMEEVV